MDKYYYENILTLTKSLCTLYISGTVESANEQVRKVMGTGLDEMLELQDELYQSMKDDGFYTVDNLKESDICKVYNKLKKSE